MYTTLPISQFDNILHYPRKELATLVDIIVSCVCVLLQKLYFCKLSMSSDHVLWLSKWRNPPNKTQRQQNRFIGANANAVTPHMVTPPRKGPNHSNVLHALWFGDIFHSCICVANTQSTTFQQYVLPILNADTLNMRENKYAA